MKTAWLYHQDGSVCVDGWSCQEQDHTSVPPRCGAPAADRPAGCELPKGHPGPHLDLAARERRSGGDGSRAVRRERPATVASVA